MVELIPHLPGFSKIKNNVDKVRSNEHVLFRGIPLSQVFYPMSPHEIEEHVGQWKSELGKQQAPLKKEELAIPLPFSRHECYGPEATQLNYRHFTEALESVGADVSAKPPIIRAVPTQIPENTKAVPIEKCAFCNPEIIKTQNVFEHNGIVVLYNRRKGDKPGLNFLILPERHTERVYGLTDEEVQNIAYARRLLTLVLQESHEGYEVIEYTQDTPAVGQTVPHTHEQLIAVDPGRIAVTWTAQSLYPPGSVDNQEMEKIIQEFSKKLQEKQEEMDKVKQESA